MPKTPVIVRPTWTAETIISAKSANYLHQFYTDHGIRPFMLNGILTLRPFFQRALNTVRQSEDPPHLLVYIGHGLSNALTGVVPITRHWNSLQPVNLTNPSILKDFIVCAIACDSMTELGPEAIKEGAITYYGSKTPIHILESDLDGAGYSQFIDLFTSIPISLTLRQSTARSLEILQDKVQHLYEHSAPGSYENGVLWDMVNNFQMLGKDVTW